MVEVAAAEALVVEVPVFVGAVVEFPLELPPTRALNCESETKLAWTVALLQVVLLTVPVPATKFTVAH